MITMARMISWDLRVVPQQVEEAVTWTQGSAGPVPPVAGRQASPPLRVTILMTVYLPSAVFWSKSGRAASEHHPFMSPFKNVHI